MLVLVRGTENRGISCRKTGVYLELTLAINLGHYLLALNKQFNSIQFNSIYSHLFSRITLVYNNGKKRKKKNKGKVATCAPGITLKY